MHASVILLLHMVNTIQQLFYSHYKGQPVLACTHS